MADNYLEKKMEEHRMRANGIKQIRRQSTAQSRPGTVTLKLARMRILVTDVIDEKDEAIISRLREAGCKVAFMCADNRLGRDLSQKTGSRFYPSSLLNNVCDDLRRQWGGIDMAVLTGAVKPDDLDAECLVVVGESPRIDSHEGKTVNAIDTTGLSPAEVGGLCVLLCLSESMCLNGVVI